MDEMDEQRITFKYNNIEHIECIAKQWTNKEKFTTNIVAIQKTSEYA